MGIDADGSSLGALNWATGETVAGCWARAGAKWRETERGFEGKQRRYESESVSETVCERDGCWWTERIRQS